MLHPKSVITGLEITLQVKSVGGKGGDQVHIIPIGLRLHKCIPVPGYLNIQRRANSSIQMSINENASELMYKTFVNIGTMGTPR